jgi:outer membrane protein OmpA-like peptidoglycan-associated protein
MAAPPRRSLVVPIAVTAIGLLAIGVAEDLPTRHSVESKLTDRSGEALRVAGLPDATVRFTGRDGTVHVHASADADRALAIVRAQEGVRVAHVVVDGPAGVAAPGQPTAPPTPTAAPTPTPTPTATAPAAPPATPSATAASTTPPAPGTPTPSTPAPSTATIQKQLNSFGQISFTTGSAALTAPSKAALAKVADVLAANPTIRIQIQGNTDSDGSAALNLALSRSRALSAYNQLRADGVAASRMTTIGFGEAHPKVPNTSDANRAINRRVDFAVVG